MKRKFGAPAGALFGVNGPQSALESRTSSLITPLNAFAGSVALGASSSREQAARARAAITTNSFPFMTVSSSLVRLPILRAHHEPEADVRHGVVRVVAAPRARPVRQAVVDVAQEGAAADDALGRAW